MANNINQRFGAAAEATAAALTDSSSGAASGTIAAIGATYDQDEVRDAVASLAAQVNALIVDNAALRTQING